MPKRVLVVDWKALPGASAKKRILHLKCNEENTYVCPVKGCLHFGHRSVRGLRKHINTVHPYYYYHDQKPIVNRKDSAVMPVMKNLRSSTHKVPAFSLQKGIGKDFLEWLTSSCGGGKSAKEAMFVGRRAMKFLMTSLGQSNDSPLQEDHVDCCVGSPQILINFLKLLKDEWRLSACGMLPYMKSITDLLDFRKASGVHDNTLRRFAVTEVYLRRARENLAKKKKIEYSRNLDLESLIAANSWASLSEVEEVIPYHTPRYEFVLKKCMDSNESANVSELTFATRYIITFLFLVVKCSRPMTYQYLTVKMVEEAATNGGFVDQTKFKTSEKYLFDTLVLTEDVLMILNSYISSIRPFLLPKCEYVILTCNGTQYTAFGAAMSLLVHQAIGKSVNPTRYRQIIESESLMQLDERERDTVSRDQKHSSGVAKRIYQKRLSREVAVDARACIQKLTGPQRESHTQDLALSICDLTEGSDPPDEAIPTSSSSQNDPVLVDDVPDEADSSVNDCDVSMELTTKTDSFENLAIDLRELELKKEEVEENMFEPKLKRFTEEEDIALKEGIKKYGFGRWKEILTDELLKFNPSRTRDTIRCRATYLKLGVNTQTKTNGRKKKVKVKRTTVN